MLQNSARKCETVQDRARACETVQDRGSVRNILLESTTKTNPKPTADQATAT
jgi:hypothetical protein